MLGHEEKFDVHVLKEEHATKVAQLKNDDETQLKSLEKKFNQEGVMAAEAEHEVLEVRL
jgi:hypothetical protein